MQWKIWRPLFSGMLCITVVITIVTTIHLSSRIWYADNTTDQEQKTSPTVQTTQSWTKITTIKKELKKWLPIRLTIPKINVDAMIQSMGLTPNGAMDVPVGPADVSWFRLGTIPGYTGSAVIAWHYGIWKNGDISVFHNLHTLRKGDTISIEDAQGEIITFVVTKLRIYDADADTSSVFRSNDGKSHLNIITCVWDKKSNTYPQRLVVFTERVL